MGIIFNGADSHYNKFDRYNFRAQYFTIFVNYSHKYELMKTVTDIRWQRLKERYISICACEQRNSLCVIHDSSIGLSRDLV
jgi:hypothetical protein